MARTIIPLLNWRGLNPQSTLAAGITPPARLEYLSALQTRISAACLGPYAGTGMGAYLEFGESNERHGFLRVNAATYALRPYVVRGADLNLKGYKPDDCDISSTSSGVGSANEIQVPSPHQSSSDWWPPDTSLVLSVKGSEAYDASPADAMDRLLESPTDGSLAGPATERFTAKRGLGISFLPVVNDDITGL